MPSSATSYRGGHMAVADAASTLTSIRLRLPALVAWPDDADLAEVIDARLGELVERLRRTINSEDVTAIDDVAAELSRLEALAHEREIAHDFPVGALSAQLAMVRELVQLLERDVPGWPDNAPS